MLATAARHGGAVRRRVRRSCGHDRAPLYGEARERMLRWLHDMECVVRRLLLLRAAPVSRAAAAQDGRARPLSGAREKARPGRCLAPARIQRNGASPSACPRRPSPCGCSAGFNAHEDQYDLGHRVDRAGKGAQSGRRITGSTIRARWLNASKPCAA